MNEDLNTAIQEYAAELKADGRPHTARTVEELGMLLAMLPTSASRIRRILETYCEPDPEPITGSVTVAFVGTGAVAHTIDPGADRTRCGVPTEGKQLRLFESNTCNRCDGAHRRTQS